MTVFAVKRCCKLFHPRRFPRHFVAAHLQVVHHVQQTNFRELIMASIALQTEGL